MTHPHKGAGAREPRRQNYLNMSAWRPTNANCDTKDDIILINKDFLCKIDGVSSIAELTDILKKFNSIDIAVKTLMGMPRAHLNKNRETCFVEYWKVPFM